MSREECVKLMYVITNTFPNWHPDNLSHTTDIWCAMLADDTYTDISTALKYYIRTDRSGFAPSISQLLAIAAERMGQAEEPELLESEAWSRYVYPAICDSAYHSQEWWERFPEEVRRAVGTPRQLILWGQDEDFNPSVVQSNFNRAYRCAVEQRTKKAAAGTTLLALMEKRKEQLKIENRNQSDPGNKKELTADCAE